jgi:ABC-type polysaccharide/polyol phosphate transport system ATPase subunit
MSKDNLDYQNISSESSEALNHHSLDSSEITIKVEHLGKVYRLYNSPIDRLKEAIHPFRKKYHKDFFALHDISFEVKKGEAIGIIGKNGSGKSTLLKLITGVLSPSSGNVTVNGRVSSLLELGAGFNPELNGIENIYFYGTINGFSKEEMDSRLDSILAFADIGEFVFQPVKSYSSGMYVRLAFAVAIQIDPGILIIDEALSVGDIFFNRSVMLEWRS